MKSGAFLPFFASLLAASALAQPPALPDDFLEGSRSGRRLSGDEIVFCVDPRDPGHEVDRAIAGEIAAALLLRPKFHVVERPLVADDFVNVYVDLVDHCHVSLGFKLLPGTYASWAEPTRAYYATGYVLVVADPDWGELTDIPRDQPLGAVPGTAGDVRLYTYLNTLPSGQRWPRHPRGTHEMALDAVLDGDLGGALVWAPSLWSLMREHERFADLTSFRASGISEPVGVGGVMLAGNGFLRNSLDDAIVALAEDGVIEQILESFAYPASTVHEE